MTLAELEEALESAGAWLTSVRRTARGKAFGWEVVICWHIQTRGLKLLRTTSSTTWSAELETAVHKGLARLAAKKLKDSNVP